MSDTPETDNLARGNHVVPTEWSEQLERERNSARKLAEEFHIDQTRLLMDRDKARAEIQALIYAKNELHREIEGWRNKWECAVEMAARAENERDEAREKLADALQEVDLRTLDFDRMRAERDEAREELSSIHRWIERNHADGFIDSLTYVQNLERVTDNWYDRLENAENSLRKIGKWEGAK